MGKFGPVLTIAAAVLGNFATALHVLTSALELTFNAELSDTWCEEFTSLV